MFPIAPSEKRPATPNGYKDATTDFERIERYLRRVPNSNWAVACGASGLFVLDIDGDKGARSFAALSSAYSQVSRTIVQATPSGGWHVFFAAPEGGLPSTVERLGAGLDTRGVGGYVLVEPSVIPNSAHKEYILMDDYPLAPAPAWLVELLMETKHGNRSVRAERLTSYDRSSSAARIAQWLSGAREGNRNNSLFWAACELRRIGLSHSDAEALLLPVALSIGLPDKEATRTIRSAFERTD